MKLYEQLAETGFHTTIITTFGIDFSAYEDLALSRLRNSGCRNNIVIVDSRMLSHALAGASSPPLSAGRYYSVVGATPKGVFHPKIILQIGRKKGRVLISSANMTCSGLAGNLEITSVLNCSLEKGGDQNLIITVWRYILSILGKDDITTRHQINWMQTRSPWLASTETLDESLHLSDGTTGMLVRTKNDTAMSQHFIAQIGDEKVNNLIVLSPYWDNQLSALKNMIQTLKPHRTSLLIQSSQPLFPKGAIANFTEIDIYDMDLFPQGKGRFVHAKILIAQTEDADHVLFGSANCTIAALGIPNVPGVNEEACLYRRLPKGLLVKSLGFSDFLKKNNRVSVEGLPDYEQQDKIPLKELELSQPGNFWCLYNEVTWQPPKGVNTNAATIKFLDERGENLDGEFHRIANSKSDNVLFKLVDYKTRPYFVIVIFSENNFSHPGIIHIQDSLQNEVREARTKRVDNIAQELSCAHFEGVWILDVLDDLQKIEQSQSLDSFAASGQSDNFQKEDSPDKTYTTLKYADFVRGRISRNERDNILRSSLSGSEISLVRAFLNRLLDIQEIRDRGESNSAKDIAAVFNNSGDTADLNSSTESSQTKTLFTDSNKKNDVDTEQEEIAIESFRQQRNTISHLEKSIVRFIEIVKEHGKAGELTTVDMLRLRALLTIIIACGYADADSSQPENLLRIDTNDETWHRMIGRILFAIFGGNHPTILGLQVDNSYDDVPDDLLECWATCYWAAAASLAIASKNKSIANLKPTFVKITSSIQMYAAAGLSQASLNSMKSVIEKMSIRFGNTLNIDGAEIDAAILQSSLPE